MTSRQHQILLNKVEIDIKNEIDKYFNEMTNLYT